MDVDSTKLRKRADELRSERNYEPAGEKFTQASYAALAETQGKISAEATHVGIGLYCLLGASVCFAVEDKADRSENRCRQGVLITDDLRENGTKYDAQRGLLFEFRGDFELIGDLGAPEKSYEKAKGYYSSYNSPVGWSGEPIFDWNYAFFAHMAKAADHQIKDPENVHSYLNKRIDYKCSHFPSIVCTVLESGEWVWSEREE